MALLDEISFFLNERDGSFQYPYYDEIRSGPRLYREPDFGVFLVACYEDLVAISRDTARFATSPVAVAGPMLAPALVAMSADEREQLGAALRAGDRLLHNEPPSHTRYRALLSSLLGRWFAQLEPMVRAHVDALIDGFVDDGEVEFVSRFADALPIRVITAILGVPEHDRHLFADTTNESVGSIDALRAMKQGGTLPGSSMGSGMGPGLDYFRPIVEARFPDTGEPLGDDDILAIMALVLGAGQGTSAKTFTQGIRILATDARWADWLAADPTRAPSFVHEVLRVETPVQGMYRMAREDGEVAGVPIAAGSTLMLMYGAANRDEAQFPDSRRFDPTRPNVARQVAFGHGPHACLGAALAQLEARVSFESLQRRLRRIRVDEERNTFPWYQSYMLHGLAELHLRFEPAM